MWRVKCFLHWNDALTRVTLIRESTVCRVLANRRICEMAHSCHLKALSTTLKSKRSPVCRRLHGSGVLLPSYFLFLCPDLLCSEEREAVFVQCGGQYCHCACWSPNLCYFCTLELCSVSWLACPFPCSNYWILPGGYSLPNALRSTCLPYLSWLPHPVAWRSLLLWEVSNTWLQIHGRLHARWQVLTVFNRVLPNHLQYCSQ